MIQIREIVYPTDFSPAADAAMHHAAQLADWHAAALHVLHVSDTDRRERELDVEAMEREAVETLRALLPAPTQARLVSAVVRNATAWKGICTYLDEHDVDLVVMGTQGRRGVSRLLLGSTAEAVVRRAGCPVMVVRARDEAAPRHAVRTILVPVDLSDLSRLALRYAAQLAQTYGARIDLLHVLEDATVAATYGVEAWLPELADSERRAQRALSRLLLEEVGYEHAVAQVRHGGAARQILSYAEEVEADLIVIGTHGRSGVERFFLGSVAEEVLRKASCPVFTLKSTDADRLPLPDAAEAAAPAAKTPRA